MIYIAHKDKNNNVQSIKQHSENVANLCKKNAVSELKEPTYMIGLLHDIGKYQTSFQKRIQGKNVKVEHSMCGALVAKEYYKNAFLLLCQYCISGHHSGIPDGGYQNDTNDMSTLAGRLKRKFEDYSEYKNDLDILQIDENRFMKYIAEDCTTKEDLIEKFAFVVRYCFSCLTDSDSLDTSDFCNGNINRTLKSNFEECLNKLNQRFSSFKAVTNLQRTRSLLQAQVYKNVCVNSKIFLMNMPTGSGKTLCSVKFALERALKMQKKRIIYVIPYNSIIDQTVVEIIIQRLLYIVNSVAPRMGCVSRNRN